MNADCQTRTPVTAIGAATTHVTAVDMLAITVPSCSRVRISAEYCSAR